MQHIMYESKRGPLSTATVNDVQMGLDLTPEKCSYDFIGRNEQQEMKHEDITNRNYTPSRAGNQAHGHVQKWATSGLQTVYGLGDNS